MKKLSINKIIKGFIGAVLIIVALLWTTFYRDFIFNLAFNKNAAIDYATLYLEEKYDKPFIYENMSLSVVEPYGYSMKFVEEHSGADTWIFVMPDSVEWYNAVSDFSVVSENYMRSYVDDMASLELNNNLRAENLFTNVENAYIYSTDSEGKISELYNSIENNKKMVECYKENIQYCVTINMKSDFYYTNHEKCADNIFDVLVYARSQGYNPKCFYFDYEDGFSLKILPYNDFTLLSREEGVETIKELIRNA